MLIAVPLLKGIAMTVESATDRAALEVCGEHFPCPMLVPGQAVVMDSLDARGGGRAERLIESRGCKPLLLPSAYSPQSG